MSDEVIEQLLAEVRELRARVEAFESERGGNRNAGSRNEGEEDEPVSRRHLLKKVGLAAAGAGAVSVLASSEPAAAANGGNVIIAAVNRGTNSTSIAWDGAAASPPFSGVLFCANSTQYATGFGTLAPAALGGWAAPGFANVPNGIYGYTEVPGGNAIVAIARGADSMAIEADADDGTAVRATGPGTPATVNSTATDGLGIAVLGTAQGEGSTALWGSATGIGASRAVQGVAEPSTAVESAAGFFSAEGGGRAVVASVANTSNTQPALHAFTNGQGHAVHGEVQNSSSGSNGVLGITNGSGSGVRGEVSNPSSAAAGVFGLTAGSGSGVTGRVVVPTSAGAGMFGATAGTGSAVRGRVTNGANTAACGRFNHDGAGPGVQGTSATGVGGTFQGAAAALRLVPKAGPGAPVSGSHQQGELVADSVGDLYYCTAAGTPGTWRRVTLS